MFEKESTMKRLYIFFSLYVLHLAKSQGTPRIVGISDDQIKSVGGTAELKCSLQYNNKYPVSWSKISQDGKSEVLISTNSKLFITDNGYKVYLNNDVHVYLLQIADVQERDSGIYQCYISIDGFRKVTAQTELKVCKTPITEKDVNFLWSPTISQMPARVVKYVGDTVQLNCSVEHNQNLFPALWIKNYGSKDENTPIAVSVNSHLLIKNDSRLSLILDTAHPNTYILEIKKVEKSDAGFYHCIVPVSASNKTLAQTELVIDENELPKILEVTKDMTVTSYGYDTSVQFSCKVQNKKGYPVLWLKVDSFNEKILSYKSTVVSGSNKYVIELDSLSSTYTLKIKNVEKSDVGTYRCRIDTTAAGSISADVKLSVNRHYGR